MPVPRGATDTEAGTTGAGSTEAGAAARWCGGRLGPDRLAAILGSALGLLAENGYDRLTLDAVAARARASKATLYRRWASKAELVVDAIATIAPSAEVPDTGSLRGDLQLICGTITGIGESRAKVMRGLATALHHHPDLMRVFEERFVSTRECAFKTVFARAAARGEILPERDLEMLLVLVPALVFHRLLLTSKPVDAAYVRRILDEVVLPLATVPPPATGPSPPWPT
ncbi:MAG TPA: TetR/AcrR family transcriptional regulator [Acidimicrobiales bacterium]|nr:TetR/AcrR family transcriptional regulator [Acidimicrobiales bacterium]